jgi:hypothetical protein
MPMENGPTIRPIMQTHEPMELNIPRRLFSSTYLTQEFIEDPMKKMERE